MADAFYLLREEGVGTAREHPLGFIDRTEFCEISRAAELIVRRRGIKLLSFWGLYITALQEDVESAGG